LTAAADAAMGGSLKLAGQATTTILGREITASAATTVEVKMP